MVMTIALVLFVTMVIGLFALGAATLAPSSELGTRLRALAGHKGPQQERSGLEERLEISVLQPLSRALPKSPGEVSRTRARLMQAGYREPRHLTYYFGLRVFLALAGLGLALLLNLKARVPFAMIVAPLLGYLLPPFVLGFRIRARQHALRLSLPDALDLTVICVEAGLGLDQAVHRVGTDLRHAHPELSDELGLVNLEMRAGKARADALRNLATRTGVDDVKALVAVLIQTERFGTSVGQALRVHSDALRTERRQRAEEAAAKTTIKMLPVLVFFIFPAMLIVTLGPAAIRIYRAFSPIVIR